MTLTVYVIEFLKKDGDYYGTRRFLSRGLVEPTSSKRDLAVFSLKKDAIEMMDGLIKENVKLINRLHIVELTDY